MKLSCDASALEWNVATFLCQDQIAIQEIIDGFDLHADNQQRFQLPERRIAKIFLFRLIYGGSAWSYANDPDFSWVSSDPDFWQRNIDRLYAKYPGLLRWHNDLVLGVQTSGIWTSPTGRSYQFQPYLKRGRLQWPRTTILNYPVQGLAADVMSVIRVELARRMRKQKYESLLVNTIHDSIDVDAKPEEWYNISEDMKSVFADFPALFEQRFGVVYNLPLRCEIKINGEKVE